jgi:hypothetical protein
MMASLDQHLIALAAAVGPDGGDGVLRVLRDVLRALAPFEAAEVALLNPAGFRRFTLTDDVEPIVAEDLLLDVSNRPEVRRFDDPAGLDVFPRSRERLLRRGLKSLLVLPLSQAGGGKGAVVLARDHTFGFVGASLRVLVPVAAMAGLALDWARALTHAPRAPETRPHAGHAPDARDAAESETTILLLRAELERQHALLATLTAERDAAQRENETLREEARGVFGARRRRR